jgi:hypothetical protein
MVSAAIRTSRCTPRCAGGAPGDERRVQRNALKDGSIVRFGQVAFRLEREPTP